MKYKELKESLYNSNYLPVGYFSIGNRPNVSLALQESIYDLSPSLSEYEREPEHFNGFYTPKMMEPYSLIKPKVAALDTELEDHYHSGFDKQGKSDAFMDYSVGSGDLNKFLIHHHLKKTTPAHIKTYSNYVRTMDNNMEDYTVPAPKDFHVYTGVGPDLDILGHRANRSNRLYLPAFTSTSIQPSTAAMFSGRFSGHGGEAKKYREVVRLHIPQGSTHGTYLGSTGLTTSLGHEHEFLLHRGHVIQFMGEPRMSVLGSPILVHDAKIIRQIRKPI